MFSFEWCTECLVIKKLIFSYKHDEFFFHMTSTLFVFLRSRCSVDWKWNIEKLCTLDITISSFFAHPSKCESYFKNRRSIIKVENPLRTTLKYKKFSYIFLPLQFQTIIWELRKFRLNYQFACFTWHRNITKYI